MAKSTNNNAKDGISERKAQHLEICADGEHYDVEGGSSGFDAVRLIHHALPDIDARSIDVSLDFLGYKISMPFMISCMTGGSDNAGLYNKLFAQVASAESVPVGMGSIRVLFRHPELIPQFRLKDHAPNVPVVANLGAVQVRDMVHSQIADMLKRLEVDALAIHLNPAQELFQPEGDRDYRGILDSIRRFCELSPVPVIVKETGCGMHPAEVIRLLRAGASYVDVAGSGGTNWITVESHRYGDKESTSGLTGAARDFASWGNPSALTIASLRRLDDLGRIPGFSSGSQGTFLAHAMLQGKSLVRDEPETNETPLERAKRTIASKGKPPEAPRRPSSEGLLGGRIIASGGIRNSLDLVRSLVLGARLSAAALPVLRAVAEGGLEGGRRLVAEYRTGLVNGMCLLDCRTTSELRATSYYLRPDFAAEVEEFCKLCV